MQPVKLVGGEVGLIIILTAGDDARLRGADVHALFRGLCAYAEYAAYVELGTGVFYPGGRQTPWVYTDAKGNTHMTHGQRAKPYIKPAVADHTPQYQKIIKSELEDK